MNQAAKVSGKEIRQAQLSKFNRILSCLEFWQK